MAYKALYRAFRPRRFDELRGQGSVATVLKNEVRAGEPAHAYIFIGPRGTGKTSAAKILACALNCLDPQDGEPCLHCENCRDALGDSMPDIIEMDAASNNGVDNARDIRDKINLLPVKGKYKIYIIDEVHELSDNAFNALLKTIEEPPPYGVFILATTELGKVPKTILSRCQRFDFRHIEEGDIIARLREVLEKLGKTAEDAALRQIALSAEGGLRDALTVLDKCCVLSDEIRMDTVLDVLNLADSASVYEYLGALRQFDEKAALSALSRLHSSGVEPMTLTGQLLGAMRDVLRASVGMDAVPQAAARLADGWGRRAILRVLEVLADVDGRMKYSHKPQILLEIATFQLLLPETEPGSDALALRMEKLERKLAAGIPAAAPVAPAPAQAPPQPEKAPLQAFPISPEDEAFMEELRGKLAENKLILPLLRDAVILRSEGNRFYLSAREGDKAIGMLKSESMLATLEAAASEIAGTDVRIEIVEPEDGERILQLYKGVKIDIID